MAIRDTLRRPRTWVVGAIALVVLVTVVAPWIYIHLVEGKPAPRLTLPDATTSSVDSTSPATRSAGGGAIDGVWKAGAGSVAGYRVGEVLFGQDNTATGRTTAVTGTLTVRGRTIARASVDADLTALHSDRDFRDSQVQGRILETSRFPKATFTLTKPITLAAAPQQGATIQTTATGTFTIHGVSRTATFPVKARWNGATIEVNGTVPIVFADYGIADPSGGPATVKDHGEIEFLVSFRRS
jgi:polyisoprenoid-binding protein YceI